MSKIKNFEELMHHQIADLISAEQQLIESMPQMAEASTEKKLKTAIEKHHKQTLNQLKRLEKVQEMLGMKPEKVTCKAMKGLIAEGTEAMKDIEPGPLLDAALIGAAQRIEHYEMAAYGTARTHAEMFGMEDVAKILQETLDEEGETDKILTEIAEGNRGVNQKAIKEQMAASKGK
jgi:ferritin-like metal-binding protein YciE